MRLACMHYRLGIACTASSAEVREALKRAFNTLARNPNASTLYARHVRLLGWYYQRHLDGALPVCRLIAAHSPSFERVHPPYLAHHAYNPIAFPLSATAFAGRTELYYHGLRHVHGGDKGAWGYNRRRPVWFGHNAVTDERYVCALIADERYELRFGTFLNPSTDVVELDATPVPCFLKCNLSRGRGAIRYCGTWRFRRVSDGTAEGGGVRYAMALEEYDARWGEARVRQI